MELEDRVWVVFNDQRPPNNRKLKSKKWAQDESLQKQYNFYIEDELLTKYNSLPEIKAQEIPVEKVDSPIEKLTSVDEIEKPKMGRPKKQTA